MFHCGRRVEIDRYDRSDPQAVETIYRCNVCGLQGPRELFDWDEQLARMFDEFRPVSTWRRLRRR
jgi:hypothetical protein